MGPARPSWPPRIWRTRTADAPREQISGTSRCDPRSASTDVIQPYGFVRSNKIAKMLLADWKIGSLATWQSGSLLGTPGSNNSIGTYLSTGYTRQVRVAGEPFESSDASGRSAHRRLRIPELHVDHVQQRELDDADSANWPDRSPVRILVVGRPILAAAVFQAALRWG